MAHPKGPLKWKPGSVPGVPKPKEPESSAPPRDGAEAHDPAPTQTDPPPKAPDAPEAPSRWRVGRPAYVGLSNFRGTLPAGKVLDRRHYDESDWRRLMQQRDALRLEAV